VGRWWIAATVGALAFWVSGCGAGGQTPEPAGPLPSAIAVEVCSQKAQAQVDEALGQSTTAVTTPTWVSHLYACNYVYRQGVIAMSVQELSSQAQTTAYYDRLGAEYGNKQPLFGLGQGAFLTANGSVVVRKDWKVLLVNTTDLKGSFSSSRSLSGTPAETIASVIMACWAGD